ncbi:hypothetical protein [Limosilactobacillus reuteri]|uniref:hypothetical protein n=1 Tax=Limosilactobacillus reuteri TaxID=1598 RepID=UPI00143219B1|nr:hypothetical protein [Limosilactobacillus reuteri]
MKRGWVPTKSHMPKKQSLPSQGKLIVAMLIEPTIKPTIAPKTKPVKGSPF